MNNYGLIRVAASAMATRVAYPAWNSGNAIRPMIDKAFEKTQENLTEASDKLKTNMDKSESRIVEYAQRLSRMKAAIKEIAADVDAKTEYEAKLSKYNSLLALVQEYTSFDSIIEEE